MENKIDGSNAYRVIDGDGMIVMEIFHEDRRQEILDRYKGLGKYASVSEDIDGDIICFENSQDDD